MRDCRVSSRFDFILHSLSFGFSLSPQARQDEQLARHREQQEAARAQIEQQEKALAALGEAARAHERATSLQESLTLTQARVTSLDSQVRELESTLKDKQQAHEDNTTSLETTLQQAAQDMQSLTAAKEAVDSALLAAIAQVESVSQQKSVLEGDLDRTRAQVTELEVR